MSLPISGFMPIPLAIMPPFMAYQSLVMGDAFGRAFQFGKRKISAMSNEEFNALTISKMFEQISNEYTRMIPTVEKSMSASLELQVTIVKELLKTLPAIGQMLNELGINATGKTLDELAHLIGLHFGHEEGGGGTPTTPTQPTDPVSCPPGTHFDFAIQQCVPDTPTPPAELKDLYYTYPLFISYNPGTRTVDQELRYQIRRSYPDIIDIVKITIVSVTSVGGAAPHSLYKVIFWYTNKTVTKSATYQTLPTNTVHPSGYNIIHP